MITKTLGVFSNHALYALGPSGRRCVRDTLIILKFAADCHASFTGALAFCLTHVVTHHSLLTLALRQ